MDPARQASAAPSERLTWLAPSVVPIPPRIRVIPIEERTKGQVKLECFLMVAKHLLLSARPRSAVGLLGPFWYVSLLLRLLRRPRRSLLARFHHPRQDRVR
jgi:hypothetical protein